MNIQNILNTYDNMFGKNTIEEIYDFLKKSIDLAYIEQDYSSSITLLNEIIGFCRDTDKKEDCLIYCRQVIELMKQLNISKNVAYGTTLLNVANAYRAFSLFDESLEFYKSAEIIYRKKFSEDEFLFAGLYNNWSILYEEMGRYLEAEKLIKKALTIVDKYPEAVIEQATTRTNLAEVYISLIKEDRTGEYKRNYYEKILEYLKEADRIHQNYGGQDFHYNSVLSAFGDAFYINKEYKKSAIYYEKAMKGLENHVGKTDAYNRVKNNYKKAKQKSYPVYLEKCREFYKKYGIPMIHEKFSEYENRIAVGLAGEGSECFGYEDNISQDHDFGIGFCMWITKEDYEKIGVRLQNEYERIIESFQEKTVSKENKYLGSRRGVCLIDSFYEKFFIQKNIIVNNNISLDNKIWLNIPESNFSASINGEVFRDDLKIFTAIREKIKGYYPERIWYMKLADQIHIFSQNAQYNYGRMMARRDYVTADICVCQAMKSAMAIVYLLNKTYAPYYKWMRRGLKDLEILSEMGEMLDEISKTELQKSAWESYIYNSCKVNKADKKVVIFEKIAEKILKELCRQNIISGTNTFLDIYYNEIAEHGGIL
ncbi:DUF4037 domain-containing protein [Lachnospiraceae bacterium 42-17]